MKTCRATHDYLISNFLGIHYSNCPKTLRRVKSKLLHQMAGMQAPSHIPAFAVNDVLVAVQKKGSAEPTQLLVLDSHEQSYKMYQLHALPVASVPGTKTTGR